MSSQIKYSRGSWYYSDGTEITFKYHAPKSVWESHDKIIRLIDYNDKSEANDLVIQLERILYE